MSLPNLVVPHPLMHQRDFVMHPLAEIAPDLMHPTLHKTIKELAASLGLQSFTMKKHKL